MRALYDNMAAHSATLQCIQSQAVTHGDPALYDLPASTWCRI